MSDFIFSPEYWVVAVALFFIGLAVFKPWREGSSVLGASYLLWLIALCVGWFFSAAAWLVIVLLMLIVEGIKRLDKTSKKGP
jgi:hypothetical protein